jgi:hypothetical protein
MPSQKCPSAFYIVPDKEKKPYNENDIFKTDRFTVLQAETLTRIKEIIAFTPINHPLTVQLLCCYRMKDDEKTYCLHRKIDNPEKQICNEKTGLKNSFIHFHINTNDLDCNDYLLAFIEGADLDDNAYTLINELFTSIVWLETASSEVNFTIFAFGEPANNTGNINHLNERLYLLKKKKEKEYQRNINYDLINISMKHENRLTVSLKNNLLSFTPS